MPATRKWTDRKSKSRKTGQAIRRQRPSKDSIATLAKSIPGIRVRRSPILQAWMVLWGRKGAPIHELSVLRSIRDRNELIDYLRSLKAR